MINVIKKFINTKQFHIYMVTLIVLIILITSGLVTLKYYVEGEENLPFELSKISVISSIDGTDVEDDENKWNLAVNQNNDIYLYIEKNNEYDKVQAIENIIIDNFNIDRANNIGTINVLKPDANSENVIFRNIEENRLEKLEYTGDLDTDIKKQKISNQGGLIAFRCAITDMGNYISKDDKEINHSELLKKINIKNDDLKFKISFDIYINLVSGNSYKANVNLELPIENVVDNGTQSKEYTDLKNIIFKRLFI